MVAARRVLAVLIVLGMTVGFGITPTVSHAQSVVLPCQTVSLPSNDPRFPASQITLTCIPPDWNKDLVIYAHGYVDPSKQLEIPPELNLYQDDGNPNLASLPAVLLSQGYAFATTSYHKNGYNVEQGGQDIDALLAFVKQGLPRHAIKHVYLIGASQGALISTMLLERSPRTYNGGALSLCGAVGGWAYESQYTGDFAAVFNYFFPGVAAQGPDKIAEAILSHQDLADQLFKVTGAAVDPLDLTTTSVSTTLQVLSFSSLAAQLDLATTAGGSPYSNLRTRYRGSLDDRTLNAKVTRVGADRAAQRYVKHFYTPSGEIKRPIVTLHNPLDPVVPFRVEQIFAKRVREEGNARLLTSIPARHSYGHCFFDPDEILNAFGVLVAQVDEPAHHH
jgi:pimeloyl-ACP methyl ester carboxylesterase